MANEQRDELVLAQNQYAFLQDETKGVVEVYVGPFKTGLTPNDRPVIFKEGKFQEVPLTQAIALSPTVPEGSYVVLENPAKGDKKNPVIGKNSPVDLHVGRKVNIPGPTSFSLWPGQTAAVVAGHQLRSNEYAIVRVYNAEEAGKNWPTEAGAKPVDLAVGDLFIIKGTDASFFIPQDGLEVVPEQGKYVRSALTLERLEYCILLDEDGNKRYEVGPKVVFPTATEKFISKRRPQEQGPGTSVFKAVELNDQMGLYIKVIADYKGEDGKEYKVGEELFITGKDQRIYYPRPEHAIIEYGSEDGTFQRQRYYGIAIPKGEARYVLNKDTGKVEKVEGPRIFLPDPRTQVIVRRVLDEKTVDLWYPGNQEAKEYNESLRSVMAAAGQSTENYVQDTSYRAAMDLQRSINRGTRGSTMAASNMTNVQADVLKRGTTFTPPPTLTLATKYDGVPTINIWTGYAVQVVDKSGKRRVVVGPATLLLEYDETLEVQELSTGKPKTTDQLIRTAYLRVNHNLVSDIARVETKDMVTVGVKVSYRVNFEGENEKWFAVENYVKFLCDHVRSLLKAAVKKIMVKELIDNSASIVRDTILGLHVEATPRTGRAFIENGMRVYDVEVLGLEILDKAIAGIIENEQRNAVQQSLKLSAKQGQLELVRQETKIDQEIADLESVAQLHRLELEMQVAKQEAAVLLAKILDSLSREEKELTEKRKHEEYRDAIAASELAREKNEDLHRMTLEDSKTKNFVTRFAAVDQKIAASLEQLSQSGMMAQLATAIAPLAVMEQQGVTHVLDRLFKGTVLEGRMNGFLTTAKTEQK